MDLGDVLLPYQKSWLEDGAQVKVVEKSRRIGLTWAQALDDVLKAAPSGRAGMDVLYISFNQDKTREYIDAVLSRLTLWGGVYIAAISVMPMFLMQKFNVQFYFGGTSLLILVGVAIDFMGQVESHLISRQYEGLMGKTRIRGRA